MKIILINPYDYNENFYKKLSEIIKIEKLNGLTWQDCLKKWFLTELTAIDHYRRFIKTKRFGAI